MVLCNRQPWWYCAIGNPGGIVVVGCDTGGEVYATVVGCFSISGGMF